MIIAIDGPSASGKSSLARRLALHFGLPHLNTGSLYRAVAKQLLDRGLSLEDKAAAVEAAHRIDPAALAAPELAHHSYSEPASTVAAMPEVRAALLAYQRDYVARARADVGAVIEGRDIGTVICPDAEYKFYITASVEERAKRRYREMAALGKDVSEDGILADIKRRDERDSTRATAPLMMAPDAYLLDTTKLDIETALQAAIAHIEAARRV
jgi:cytidylate kinase